MVHERIADETVEAEWVAKIDSKMAHL